MTVDAGGFYDGHLGRVEKTIEVRNGHFKQRMNRGQMSVVLEFDAKGDRVSGRVFVTPSLEWQDVRFDFDGSLESGVFTRKFSGQAQVDSISGRGIRYINVTLRLQR